MSRLSSLAVLQPIKPAVCRVRSKVIEAVQVGSCLTGLSAVRSRRSSDGGAIILAYHSVIDAEWEPWIDPDYAITAEQFQRHVDYLVRHRNVVSMCQLETWLEQGRTPPTGTVAITFDDGYRNNLTTAAPILAEAGLPATFYLATAFMNTQDNQWIDTIFVAFRHRTRSVLSFDGTTYDLDGESERQQAHATLCAELVVASAESRERILDDVHEQLKPSKAAPQLMMDWTDVKELDELSEGFDIGVHTRNHVNLSTLSEEEAREEIVASIDDVSANLNHPPQRLAYPFGYVDPSGGRLAGELGLRSAVITEPPAVIGGRSDLFTLARLGGVGSTLLFRSQCSDRSPFLDRSAVDN